MTDARCTAGVQVPEAAGDCGMGRGTDELKREHLFIKRALGILETVAARLERGRAVAAGDLDGLLEFLSVYADRCHHAKEEDCLFPALLRKGMPREGGPIGIMEEEHVVGRGLLARMGEACGRIRSGESAAAGAFCVAARSYAGLLREHIDKEDTVLFPMADEVLSPVDDLKLTQEFEVFELDRIGAGRHRALEERVENLEARYAS